MASTVFQAVFVCALMWSSCPTLSDLAMYHPQSLQINLSPCGFEMLFCQTAFNGSGKSSEATDLSQISNKVMHQMAGWPSLSLRRAPLCVHSF
eukprot:948387-Pelagomonas_calceolata.AAC.1